MSLLDSLKGALGAKEEQPFDYQCKECDTKFMSTGLSISDATCPACDAGGVQSIRRL